MSNFMDYPKRNQIWDQQDIELLLTRVKEGCRYSDDCRDLLTKIESEFGRTSFGLYYKLLDIAFRRRKDCSLSDLAQLVKIPASVLSWEFQTKDMLSKKQLTNTTNFHQNYSLAPSRDGNQQQELVNKFSKEVAPMIQHQINVQLPPLLEAHYKQLVENIKANFTSKLQESLNVDYSRLIKKHVQEQIRKKSRSHKHSKKYRKHRKTTSKSKSAKTFADFYDAVLENVPVDPERDYHQTDQIQIAYPSEVGNDHESLESIGSWEINVSQPSRP